MVRKTFKEEFLLFPGVQSSCPGLSIKQQIVDDRTSTNIVNTLNKSIRNIYNTY